MLDKREPKAAPQFSQPIRQSLFMAVVLGLVVCVVLGLTMREKVEE